MADERGYLPYDYPLIKTVWAVEGDEVCYHKSSVSVPKRSDIALQLRDVLGRDMPALSGCRVLESGEYMLLSPDVKTGFDSRYFGPEPLSAHLFLRPTKYSWWAKLFAQVPIAPRKSAGPKRKNGQKRLFWGFCL